jgi:hypothetical protein
MFLRSFLSFVDAHVPEGRLRKRWGQYSPDRYPVPSEHSGDGFERVIRQKAGKEALSPMVKGKRLKEKHHNCERSVFPLAFVLEP